MTKVAVIGAGLIGRSWAIVFARAGFSVALWDPFPRQTTAAMTFIADRLPELRQAGLLADEPDAVLARITPIPSMFDAVKDVDHVQENGPEQVPAKQALFAELDRATKPDSVLASSTSGIPASAFTESLKHRGRCLVAHPVNPPYLVPSGGNLPSAVDRCGGGGADAGFDASRGSGAGDGEEGNGRVRVEPVARRVVGGGVPLARGRRDLAGGFGCAGETWAWLALEFHGPLETIDLNAPGGLKDYCDRYGPLYAKMQEQAVPLKWDDALVNRLHEARRDELPLNMAPVRQEWRDRRLMALLAHKAGQPDRS